MGYVSVLLGRGGGSFADQVVYSTGNVAAEKGGRLKFVELVTEATIAKEILQSMGLPTEPPPVAKARSPDIRDETPPADAAPGFPPTAFPTPLATRLSGGCSRCRNFAHDHVGSSWSL